MKNSFFYPTPIYKEYKILDLIYKKTKITQRSISKRVNIAVSMVNQYLDSYEKQGYLIREYISPKTINYNITQKGKDRLKILNLAYLNASHHIFESAMENIKIFLNYLERSGFIRILLYGAGNVADILLQSITFAQNTKINIVGIIDDDAKKQGSKIAGINVYSDTKIYSIDHDCIIISSYKHNQEIYKKLLSLDYEPEKIIQYFNSKQEEIK